MFIFFKPNTSSISHILNTIKRISHQIYEDRVPLYAAQASFFVIVSAVPFLSLLVTVILFFVSEDTVKIFNQFSISKETMHIHAPKLPLLSFSTIITLWSASRGTSAIRKGIETVYLCQSTKSFFISRLKGLLSTLTLIVLIVSTVVILLFGDLIGTLIGSIQITDIILHFRTPFFLLFISIIFATIYTSAAKRSSIIYHSFLSQLPGAVFASFGWILFSYFYALYIKYFPNASYIYGSLSAICLIMLWLYFCMIILLLGAELNKFFSFRKKKSQRTSC